jgi:hypothetical protein
MKPPEGMGWSKVGAKGWLKKRFGAESTSSLSKQQLVDAIRLLEARIQDSEDSYESLLDMMVSEGRALGDPEA